MVNFEDVFQLNPFSTYMLRGSVENDVAKMRILQIPVL
jgi:hypothetical protein